MNDLSETRSAAADGAWTTDPSVRARLVAFYERHFRVLVDSLRKAYGAGPPDPEDVAQRAFERLALRSNVDEVEDLEAYVWITARNVLMSDKRAQRVRERNEDDVTLTVYGSARDEADPERTVIAREQLDIISETLAAMPERRRRLFLLHRVDGLSLKEAGARCGVGATAAHRHVAIAMSRIAAALARSAVAGGVNAAGGGGSEEGHS